MKDSEASRRLAHEREVLTALRRSPETSQPKLIEQTQLARGTVVSILDRLEKKKIIDTESPNGSGSKTKGGRPAKVVRLRQNAGYAASVDFGHRHVRVAVGDLRGYKLLLNPKEQKVKRSTEAEFEVGADAEASLDTAAQLLQAAIDEQGGLDRLVAVTVGFPAPVRNQVEGPALIDDSMPQWRGIQPKEELQQRLGWHGVPFFVENDANLGALAELEHGVGREHGHFIYVKWSSGIGGAVVSNHRLDRGASGIGCELGHMVLPDEEPATQPCPCCKSRRCLEVLAGGTAVVDRFNETHKGEEVESLRDVIWRAQEGLPGAEIAREKIGCAATLVGQALGSAANVLEPSAIVIGGHFGYDPSAKEPDPYELVAEGIRRGLRSRTYPRTLDNLSLTTSRWRYGAAQGGVVLALRHRLAEFVEQGRAQAAR